MAGTAAVPQAIEAGRVLHKHTNPQLCAAARVCMHHATAPCRQGTGSTGGAGPASGTISAHAVPFLPHAVPHLIVQLKALALPLHIRFIQVVD